MFTVPISTHLMYGAKLMAYENKTKKIPFSFLKSIYKQSIWVPSVKSS